MKRRGQQHPRISGQQSAGFQIRLVSTQTLLCICVKRLEGHGPSPGAAGIELGFPNHVSIFARVMSRSR